MVSKEKKQAFDAFARAYRSTGLSTKHYMTIGIMSACRRMRENYGPMEKALLHLVEFIQQNRDRLKKEEDIQLLWDEGAKMMQYEDDEDYGDGWIGDG